MAKTSGTIDLKSMKKAAQGAVNYITDINNEGILVHPVDDEDNGVRITDVVEIVRDGKVSAEYGESIILGNRDENSVSEKLLYLDSGSVSIKSGAYHTINKDTIFEVSESISSIVINTSASTMTYTDTNISNIKSIREVTLNGNALIQKTDYTINKTNNTIALTNTQTPTDGGVLVIAYVPNVIRQTITFSTDFDSELEREWNNMPDNTANVESVYLDDTELTEHVDYEYESDTRLLKLKNDPSTGHTIKVIYTKDPSHFYTLGKRNMEAIGDYSIATGINCEAEGYGSFAGGRNTHVKGDYSFGFGYGTGDDDSTEVDGRYSGAIGTGLQVTGHNSFAVGKYNKPSTGLAFTVGNGSNAYNKSNAFWVGRTGNIGFAKGIYAGTSPSASDRVPLFATGTGTATITVDAGETSPVAQSINIAKTGYTPWAINGIDITSSSCNLYRYFIEGNKLYYRIHNTSSSNVSVTITARISYIATSAL